MDEAWHGEIADRDPALWSVIEAAGVAHGTGMKSYLIMMAVRLLELKRVLKPTGSIYLHCDPTANAYLRLLMDAVFGQHMARREIIWKMPRPSGFKTRAKNWIRNHDVLLYYLKSKNFTFNKQFEEYEDDYLAKFDRTDEDGRRYWLRGRTKRYLGKGYTIGSVWTDIHSMQTQGVSAREGLGYPTQKPLALLERIIRASSNEDDIVLDPFCGCATTLVAAETLQRQWTGIDLSPLAVKLLDQRLRDVHGAFGSITPRRDIPQRTDLGKLPDYRTHKHTLYGRQEGKCNGCKIHFPFRNFTIDHIVPQSKEGTHHINNLQLLCGACNSKKGNHSMEQLIAQLKYEGIR